MDKAEVIYLSNHYLDKVAEHYGHSKFQKTYPYLTVEDSYYSDAEDKDTISDYCFINNEIQVYWKNIENEESLIRSIIHEYKHYLQSPAWMARYYKQGYSYSDHPYEIEAYKEEENWNKFLTNRL
jgi:hypothetical protein